MFGQGTEVLGCYVCLTQAGSFLPFLIKFLYGDDHWKWHDSRGLVSGANKTRESN